MMLEEFRRLVDAWGADVDRWPEQQQTAAQALAASPEASAMLIEARRLDAVLARPPAVAAQRAQRAAHLVTTSIAVETGQETWWRRLVPSRWLVPAASLACSALLGILLAQSLPYLAGRPDQPAILGMILDSMSLMAGLEVR